MTYSYAIYRGPLLMTRTMTLTKAEKIAAGLGGDVRIVEQAYISGGN